MRFLRDSALFFGAMCFLALSQAALLHAAPVEYQIDTQESVIKWTGKKVSGEHNGVVKISGGTVTLEEGKLTGGEFEIDMSSITNKDLQDPEYKNKLESHLKSDDFFNVQEFPKGKFVITSVTPQGEGKYQVAGKLTVKNITQPVSFTSQVMEADEGLRGKAKVTIDRLKWDIRYNSGKFFDIKELGDKLIYDEVQIELDMLAEKPAA